MILVQIVASFKRVKYIKLLNWETNTLLLIGKKRRKTQLGLMAENGPLGQHDRRHHHTMPLGLVDGALEEELVGERPLGLIDRMELMDHHRKMALGPVVGALKQGLIDRIETLG
jgi:hypothetical protein